MAFPTIQFRTSGFEAAAFRSHSKPPKQHKNDNNDQDGADGTDATVPETVAVAAEAAIFFAIVAAIRAHP